MTSAGKTAARITMRVYSGPVCDNIGQIRVFPDQLVGPHIGSGQLLSKVQVYPTWCQSDPPEKYHLNVKKLPKTGHFFKKIAKNCHFFKKIAIGNFFEKKRKFLAFFLKKCQVFGNFIDSQMAIFRRVRSERGKKSNSGVGENIFFSL